MPDWSIPPAARGFHPSPEWAPPADDGSTKAGTVNTNLEPQRVPPTRLLLFRERCNRLILRLNGSAETQGKWCATALQHQLQQAKVVLILTEASI